MPFPPVQDSFIRTKAIEVGVVGLDDLYPFMAQIVNAYSSSDGDTDARNIALVDTLNFLKRGTSSRKPEGVRAALIENLNSFCWVSTTPALALAVPLPDLAIPPAPTAPTRNNREAARVRGRRSGQTNDHGKRMVAAAKGMDGWFHWVSSGPVPSDLPDLLKKRITPRTPFAPKETWSIKQTETGWEEDDPRENDFARWMNGNGPEPDRTARMNCWEAVFFTAYKAGLVTVQGLRAWHRNASAAALELDDGREYYRILNDALGVQWAERVSSEAGLIPQPGDIIFFDLGSMNDHICLSLGRTWFADEPVDDTFSLWHHNNKTYGVVTTAELSRAAGEDIFFAPCPF